MNGYVGSWIFVAQYCAFVFLTFIGLLQIVAARWHYRGIAFFLKRMWGYAFGTIAITGVCIWFFGFTGLDLSQPTFDTPPQLCWLAVSVACAFIFTLALSSIINRRMGSREAQDSIDTGGLEVLKRMTYWQCIRKYFHRSSER